MRKAVVPVLLSAAVAVASVAMFVTTGTGTGTGTEVKPAKPPKVWVLTGTVIIAGKQCAKNACWTCNTAVNLDSVTIVVAATTERVDAVKLAKGCTGKIRNLNVTTASGDGVKVADGTHDLTITGGTISCTGRFGIVHQDGIQVMGGDKITFHGLTVKCPVSTKVGMRLNHSAFFINTAAKVKPAHAVVFESGVLGSAGTTVDIGTSDASGVRNSLICPSTTIGRPFNVPTSPSGGRQAATHVVNTGNTFKTC